VWALFADSSCVQRLNIDQPVTLILDEVPEPIECRVLDAQGSVTRLAYQDALPPRAVGLLVQGSAGYAVFDEFGAAVGLRVAVRASPPYLDVAVTDGVEVPERRGNERVKLVTRARIVRSGEPDGELPDEWTYTIDLSETGALLRDHPVFTDHQRFALELMFGSDPRPVAARTEIVRRTQDAVGIRFESISVDDATRLTEYLMGIRHQRAPARS
jgi:hypothetical protein